MNTQLYIKTLLIPGIITLFSACNTIPDRHDYAEIIAQKGNMTKKIIESGHFSLTTYSKLNNENTDLLIAYIEGDGYAFQGKHRLSRDPTPKDPVGLKLAIQDPNPSVVYIARPCQYLTTEQLKTCSPEYWSTHRYSEETVSAIDNVINGFARGYREIVLVGYSGGGTIAALIAARHQNIKTLITVAANLDHKTWTDIHQVSPLESSLNAKDNALLLKNTKQWHFAGGKDEIVPVPVINSYMQSTGNYSNARMIVIPEFDHQCCWVENWKELLCELGEEFSDYCSK